MMGVPTIDSENEFVYIFDVNAQHAHVRCYMVASVSNVRSHTHRDYKRIFMAELVGLARLVDHRHLVTMKVSHFNKLF